MPVDTSIYNGFLAQPKSALDYQNEFMGAEAQRQKIQQNAFSLQGAQASLADAQRVRDEQSGIRSALASLPPTSTPDDQVKALRALGTPTALTTADTLATSYGNQQVSAATAKEKTSIAGKNDNETAIAKHQQHLQALAAVQTPEDAVQWALDGVKSGALPAEGLPQALQKIGAAAQAPGGLDQWKQQTAQTGQTIQQQLEMTTAKPTEVRLGNVVKMIDTNPHSPTYGKEVVAPQAIGVSPDTVATQAGENSRSAAGIKKDLAVAGLNPDGGVNGNQEAMAQLIAAGKAPAPSGMAAARPGVGALMARVSQINPDYDATTYNAKNAAAKGFTSGQQGNALRSISTASEHLSQLDKLGDALENGKYPLVNTIGNAYGIQTGQAPAQVFNAVKGVVAQEVVKAIVAGGGSAGERDEAAKAFSNASSPAQLKQTIQAYRTVMQAQKSNLLDQRRAAGLPDSTLPAYVAPGGSAAGGAPAGIDPNAIAAELAKRGVK